MYFFPEKSNVSGLKIKSKRCDMSIYTKYLLIEPQRTTCTGISEILKNVSHDSVNRFLEREQYTPRDLYDSVQSKIVSVQ